MQFVNTKFHTVPWNFSIRKSRLSLDLSTGDDDVWFNPLNREEKVEDFNFTVASESQSCQREMSNGH